ncbi:MAG: glutamate--tRNA ligase [Deltaproteobacteria bacterium]|jgi:glutamyl-tRNA synthetase|nr:glutamate--tRNA ligase [Deltaproteobacteria bacterium]
MRIEKSLDELSSLEEAEALFPPRMLPAGTEVLRLAPSPTGLPHIGTAMQAVLNRALAQKSGGVFILRIEDTDRARLIPGAEKAVLEALAWLGLAPDEGPNLGGTYGPYRQSERLRLYELVAAHLLASGQAYRCFCPPARLEALRNEQMRAGENPRYDRKCLKLSQEECKARMEAGERSVIRFRIPGAEAVSFFDEVRGEISFAPESADDPVILKSDGYPTYHLAALVDDHFMRVSTVVRGEEWISSTPKHILLYKALGWSIPKFLHTVILRDEQRRKLSKRSGDTSLRWYQTRGYLPEGFRNFLTRILWAHPLEKDIYDFREFVELFSTRSLPRTGPVVDNKLLDFVNGQYLHRLAPAQMRSAFLDYLALLENSAEQDIAPLFPAGLKPECRHALKADLEADSAYAERVFALEPERNRRLADVFLNNGFFFESCFVPPSPALLLKHCPEAEQARLVLEAVLPGNISGLAQEDWDSFMRQKALDFGLKPKAVFMLTRLALTGLEKTPPLYDIVVILGPERIRDRIGRTLNLL